MTDEDKLTEVFGEEFAEQIDKKVEEKAEDEQDELHIRMASVLECINKGKVDTEYVLANIDADEHPEEFETLEEAYQVFQQIEAEFSQDKYGELTSRDYDLDE